MFTSWLYFFFGVYVNGRCVVNIASGDDVATKWSNARNNNCNLRFLSGNHVATSHLYWNDINGGDWSDPIEIYGDGIDNTKFTMSIGQNIMNVAGSYFRIRDIELVGGDIGIRFEYNASYAQFISLKIHGTNTAAAIISTNSAQVSNSLFKYIEAYNLAAGNGECFAFDSNFHDNKIEYCLCRGNNVYHGINTWQPPSYNNIIQNNVFIRILGDGIRLSSDNNLGNNIIYNNIILNTGGWPINIPTGAELYNNIIARLTGTGIHFSHPSPRNIKLIGNTIVCAANPCFEAYNWHQYPETFEISNNLFLCGTDTSKQTVMYFSPSSGVVGTVLIDNNAMFGNDLATSYGSFNIQLTTVTGNVQDWSDYNFYPTVDSEFLNGGAYNSDIPTDFDCVERSNPPDIGVYEYILDKTQSIFYVNPNNYNESITFTNLCGVTSASPTSISTNVPTTSSPTTKSPTTVIPTTSSPTTETPTTKSPTTAVPTMDIATNTPTSIPTTSTRTNSPTYIPTTLSPSTNTPITESPITFVPTMNHISNVPTALTTFPTYLPTTSEPTEYVNPEPSINPTIESTVNYEGQTSETIDDLYLIIIISVVSVMIVCGVIILCLVIVLKKKSNGNTMDMNMVKINSIEIVDTPTTHQNTSNTNKITDNKSHDISTKGEKDDFDVGNGSNNKYIDYDETEEMYINHDQNNQTKGAIMDDIDDDNEVEDMYINSNQSNISTKGQTTRHPDDI